MWHFIVEALPLDKVRSDKVQRDFNKIEELLSEILYD